MNCIGNSDLDKQAHFLHIPFLFFSFLFFENSLTAVMSNEIIIWWRYLSSRFYLVELVLFLLGLVGLY